MPRAVRLLFASLFSIAVTIPSMSAQQLQDQDASSAPRKLDKEQKKKIKKSLKELEGPYKQWLSEDVIYIISP